jgi:O-antigen/teichoic acid export membrane protein
MGAHAPGSAVKIGGRRFAFVRMLSSGLTMQALVSIGSFVVGLILIRRTKDAEYGYYVLVTNALLLLATLQIAFIQPPLVTRLARLDAAGRAAFVGGLYRNLRRIWPSLTLATAVVALLLRVFQVIGNHMLLLVLAAGGALLATLYREFFRVVLLAYRRPHSVLAADAVYVALLVCGAWLASLGTLAAALAALTLGLSALVGGRLCSGSLWRFEPWNIGGSRGVLAEIAPLALWSTGGAAVHWLFSQGYSYVVAGTLDVTAVAAIAAMRLLVMPVNLLSTGLGSIMLPAISAWLNTESARKVFGRQIMFSLGLASLALGYFGLVWWLRDPIFIHVLKRHSPSFDVLLLLWSAVALLMLFRDQLIYLLVVRGRFRPLAGLTLMSAVLALVLSYAAMREYGVAGALVGVLLGETLNVVGILILCVRETRDNDAIVGLPGPAKERVI